MIRTPDFFTSVLAVGGKISGQLQNKDGTLPNLTGCTLMVLMRQPGADSYRVMALAEVTDEIEARWEYEWQDGDRDIPGDFKLNIMVTFPDGEVDQYPEPGYILVRISSDD